MIRDKVYSFLYDSKKTVIKILNSVIGFNVIVAVTLLLLENGFYLTDPQKALVLVGFRIVFFLFAIRYVIRFLYEFDRWKFLKETWIELFLTIILIGVPLIANFQEKDSIAEIVTSAKATTIAGYYHLLITVYMIYVVGFNFVRASAYINSLAIKPASTLVLSFFFLIVFGTGLLMLPKMSIAAGGASFLEALFTAVSASCVTGLIVVDTATFYTTQGQLVILVLIQLGGIGIVSFASFFALFLKSSAGLKQNASIQAYLDSDSVSSAQDLLKEVIKITLLIELMSAIAIFFSWGDQVQFDNLIQKIFYSVFHGVSAFCNAGFSLFSNGLYQNSVMDSSLLHVVIAGTVILGSLGFATIEDMFSFDVLRERLEKPWKDWKLSTKISVHTSVSLILVGMLVFFLLEKDNAGTIGELGQFKQLISSFFQSVTTRTAGFNTVDMGALTDTTLIFFIFLMFIGASSGSTGGGIKTSTFIIILTSAISTIRGKKQVSIGNRTISHELLFRAFTVFVFAATFNLVTIFVLSITESGNGFDLVDLVFEQISAFATVGLSTGITADLTPVGKSIIILSMFIGRIGTLTLALAISSRVESNNYKYPNAHLLVG